MGKDANVAVQFDAPGEGKTPASFQGNLVAGTPGGVDCVLLFDGKEFRLEKLEGQVKSLRQIRNEASTNPICPRRASWASNVSASPRCGFVHTTAPRVHMGDLV